MLLDGSPAPRLKICDTGYSKSAVGTLAYIAPEVLLRNEYDGKQQVLSNYVTGGAVQGFPLLQRVLDYNEDGKHRMEEFSALVDAFRNQLAANKMELFKAADMNQDTVVSVERILYGFEDFGRPVWKDR